MSDVGQQAATLAASQAALAAAKTIMSRQRALQGVRTNTTREVDPQFNADLAEASEKAVEIAGRKAFFALRTRWSTAIIWWISILIASNVGLTVAVGAGWLKFDNLQWFVTAITVETFLQTVGLGYVAANFLFSDGTGKSGRSTAPRPRAKSSKAQKPTPEGDV